MIFGIGIDEIEVDRVEEKLGRTDGLREKLFTPGEIEYCESKKFKEQHYAARYAAKEAFFKALGTGWRQGLAYQDVEIVHDNLGKPACELHGRARQFIEEKGITGVHVSLTHLSQIAAAIVLLEK